MPTASARDGPNEVRSSFVTNPNCADFAANGNRQEGRKAQSRQRFAPLLYTTASLKAAAVSPIAGPESTPSSDRADPADSPSAKPAA